VDGLNCRTGRLKWRRKQGTRPLCCNWPAGAAAVWNFLKTQLQRLPSTGVLLPKRPANSNPGTVEPRSKKASSPTSEVLAKGAQTQFLLLKPAPLYPIRNSTSAPRMLELGRLRSPVPTTLLCTPQRAYQFTPLHPGWVKRYGSGRPVTQVGSLEYYRYRNLSVPQNRTKFYARNSRPRSSGQTFQLLNLHYPTFRCLFKSTIPSISSLPLSTTKP